MTRLGSSRNGTLHLISNATFAAPCVFAFYSCLFYYYFFSLLPSAHKDSKPVAGSAQQDKKRSTSSVVLPITPDALLVSSVQQNMTTLDTHTQRYGHMPFDTMSSGYPHQPQFTNPWPTTTAPQSHSLYAAGPSQVPPHSLPSSNPMGLDRHAQQPAPRSAASATLAPYASAVPVTTAPAGSPLNNSMMDPSLPGQANLLSLPQDLMTISRLAHPSVPATTASSYATAADSGYHPTASPVHATYAPSPASYDSMAAAAYPSSSVRHGFGLATDASDHARRYSQSSVSSTSSSYDPIDVTTLAARTAPRSSLVNVDFRNNRALEDQHRGFRDALEAGQGMMSLKFDTSAQETPRAGVYNNRGRGSGDSYGFPSTHSTSSSMSSNGFSPYYSGSVDGSVSDYSTAGSDIESVNGSNARSLPRPQSLMPNQPPAPQSMMSQFSSKVASSTQKKHMCKVCEKRFTRPSSLQTHMYSHTGEKRE